MDVLKLKLSLSQAPFMNLLSTISLDTCIHWSALSGSLVTCTHFETNASHTQTAVVIVGDFIKLF